VFGGVNSGRSIGFLTSAFVGISSFGGLVVEMRMVADVGGVRIVILGVVRLQSFGSFVAVKGGGSIVSGTL